ncbi:hypothetical protein [Thiolapillus sp.]|uniref:hypothetical protein n=1 Tax=Thiolapillus sp. TaxID=2017437 RepID=UPI002739B4D9|nr:hypothetical protein [Thiolapillus sp.]
MTRTAGTRIGCQRPSRFWGLGCPKIYHEAEDALEGGVISPLLANLYLHYTLDLWFQRRFQPSCTGPARLIRYADDYVACFKHDIRIY